MNATIKEISFLGGLLHGYRRVPLGARGEGIFAFPFRYTLEEIRFAEEKSWFLEILGHEENLRGR